MPKSLKLYVATVVVIGALALVAATYLYSRPKSAIAIVISGSAGGPTAHGIALGILAWMALTFIGSALPVQHPVVRRIGSRSRRSWVPSCSEVLLLAAGSLRSGRRNSASFGGESLGTAPSQITPPWSFLPFRGRPSRIQLLGSWPSSGHCTGILLARCSRPRRFQALNLAWLACRSCSAFGPASRRETSFSLTSGACSAALLPLPRSRGL